MASNFVRSWKTGTKNFLRNGLLSVATISVIAMTLFIINIEIAMLVANNLFLEDIQEKVRISVYLKPETSESKARDLENEIRSYEKVSLVEYVSKEVALENFREKNKDNESFRRSLEELGMNPLGAVINVKADNPDDYETIAGRIESGTMTEYISKVNYRKYSSLINGLNDGIKSNRKSAIIFGITFSIIAILITFNSIRITMYSHRREIEIMRLVGASDNYIRLPFIWEGILYGVTAAVITIPIAYAYLYFSGGETNSILPSSNTEFLKDFLNNYFNRNLFLVIFVQFSFGILLGVTSSMIAIKKYLDVKDKKNII